MIHPLAKFLFCPCCGSAHFEVNDFKSKRCTDCGFTFYHNAAAATVAVILNSRNELLVTRRAFNPAAGTLDLPGGFVDAGETAEEGIVREVEEETGGKAVVEKFLFSLPNEYVYSDFIVHTTDLFFLCQLLDETALIAHDDAAALFWIPLADIRPSNFGLASIAAGVQKLLESNISYTPT